MHLSGWAAARAAGQKARTISPIGILLGLFTVTWPRKRVSDTDHLARARSQLVALGMPPTVLDKVCKAIETLAEPGGASRVAIAKFVKETFGEVSAPLLKKALATGVQKGKLVQNGQRFALAGVEIAPRAGESVEKTVIKAAPEGSRACESGDTVDMKYIGTLQEGGAKFDAAAHFKFTLGIGEVIKGWDAGVAGMREGERARLVVPSKLGYGKRGSPPEIPGDATLVFDVTLNKIM